MALRRQVLGRELCDATDREVCDVQCSVFSFSFLDAFFRPLVGQGGDQSGW